MNDHHPKTFTFCYAETKRCVGGNIRESTGKELKSIERKRTESIERLIFTSDIQL